MGNRRQFIQAAAITPFAIAATPYKVKPSWYLEPEDRKAFFVSQGRVVYYHENLKWYHRETKKQHSLQDPSINWSTSSSVRRIVHNLLQPFHDRNYALGDRQTARILASSFWDFEADLHTPVPVSVNRGITYVTAADLLEWQDITKHPSLQYSKGPNMTPQDVLDYNGIQRQPFKVDDVVFHPSTGSCYDVMEVDGSELWLSIGSLGVKRDSYHTPLDSPRGVHCPDTSNWFVLPETIPRKGHQLTYGDIVVPTLGAHRVVSDSSKEFGWGLSAHTITVGLDTSDNTVDLYRSDMVFESDDLICLGHDIRPLVIYDDLGA